MSIISPWHRTDELNRAAKVRNRMGTAAAVAIFAIISGTFAAETVGTRDNTAPAVAAVQHDRPCTTEDDPGPCVWDAQHQGNEKGKSFRVNPDGSVTYL